MKNWIAYLKIDWNAVAEYKNLFMLKEMVILTFHIIGVSTDYPKADKNENSLHNSEIYIFAPNILNYQRESPKTCCHS